jgi:hypothetical protein
MWVNPKNPKAASEYQIISGGGAINFWKIEGSHLQKKSGRFGSNFKQVPIVCAANLNMKEGWRIVAGGGNGDLMVFEEREVISCVEGAHCGSVFCMAEVRMAGVCVYVCVYVDVDVYVDVCVYVCVDLCAFVREYMWMSVCVRVYMYMYMYMYVYVYVYVYENVYVYVYVCVYVCVCVCVRVSESLHEYHNLKVEYS